MRKLTIIILCVVNLIYILLGGALFSYIESSHASEKRTLSNIIEEVIENRTCISTSEIESLAGKIISAYNAGSNIANFTRSKSNWSYSSSIFFAITATTTIGYGHVTPVTPEGQLACCLYILIGLPLMAALLTGIGTNMSACIKFLINQKVWVKSHPLVDCLLKMVVVNFSLLGLVIQIPAAIFSYMEDWTYGESVYFVIITLTTVGFGDYYIDDGNYDDPKVVYKTFSAVWIVIGLAVVATFISDIVTFFTVGQEIAKPSTHNTKIKQRSTKPEEISENC